MPPAAFLPICSGILHGVECWICYRATYTESLNRSLKTFERQFARGIGYVPRLDRCLHFGVDKNFAVLGIAAQARCQIDHRTDRGIVEAALESDPAKRGVAVGNADAKSKLVTVFAPANAELAYPLAHLQSQAHCA